MDKKNILQWVLVIGFLAVLAFLLVNKKDTIDTSQEPKENLKLTDVDIKQINIAGTILNVELAVTLEAQAQGLSGRSELKEDESMLFVFDSPGKYSFWMKDMNFPIDIIWIGSDLRVVYIKKNARPDSYPSSFAPEREAKYVLETVSGFSEKNNLKEGNKVEFIY